MGGSTQGDLSKDVQGLAGAQADRIGKLVTGNLNFLSSVLGDKFGSNWNAIPGEVHRAFDGVRNDTEKAYQNAAFSSQEATRYAARTSGENISRGQVDAAVRSNAFNLDRDRRFALGQIQLDEANAGLTANNALMRLFTGAGQTALGLASTYQSQAVQAAGMTSNVDPWGAALGGAAQGAGAGSVFGPWGAVAGGVLGGAMGYLGSK